MRFHDLDCVSQNQFPETLPLALEQRPSRTTALVFLAMLIPAVLAAVVPLMLVLQSWAYDAPAWQALQQQPLSSTLVLAGICIWLIMWVVPSRHYLARLDYTRHVAIDPDGAVTTRETTWRGTRTWKGRLSDFQGLRHDVRSTLSGTRRSLNLIHADPTRSLMIHTAPVITDTSTARLAALLEQPVLPSAGDVADAANSHSATADSMGLAQPA